MTMKENLSKLRELIRFRFGKEIHFYNLPKEKNAADLLSDEMALSLVQNKNMRHYYKDSSMIIPIYRGVVLDGAVIVMQAEDLSINHQLQLTELVELLVTDILSLEEDIHLLQQTESQLNRQLSTQKAFYTDSLLSDLIH